MVLIASESVPRLELDRFNDDHNEESELINKLGHLCRQARELDDHSLDQAIGEAFAELCSHCEDHFAEEEQQMSETEFPRYAGHKAEHDRVLSEMYQLQSQWQAKHSLIDLADYVENDLPEWFIRHIETMDATTAAYIEGYTKQLSSN